MTNLKRTMATGALLGAVALTVACGSGSAVNGPSEATTTGARGATIQGTVDVAGASASQVSAQATAAGVRVSVVGTSLATTTDAAGGFVIAGVTSSEATLRFESAGVDARLVVSGLVDGQVLSINVSVQGSQATMGGPRPSPTPSPSATPSPSPEDETELRGTIESIAAPNLVVSGRLVRTDGSTRIRRSGNAVPFSALAVGQSVEVEGAPNRDGSVQATRIGIEDGPNDDNGRGGEAETEFTGRVDSVTPPTLRVSGRLVVTDGSTRIERRGDAIALGAIHAGDTVEVEGTQLSDGSVRAKKVKLED